MSERVFEPILMFFGLTNSSATFQAMMSNLLRDIIAIGDVLIFIDDVLVGIETEEGHNCYNSKTLEWVKEKEPYIE